MMDASWIDCLLIGYSHHTSPFTGSLQKGTADNRLLLRFQVKGTCRVEINDETHVVQPGDLIIRKPGEYYRLVVEANKDADASQPIESADYYLSCSGVWAQQWCSRNDFPSKVHLDTAEDFLALWRKLIYEKRNIHGDNAEMMDALIKVLCLTIERDVRKQMAAASRPELNIPYKMKQYLEKHATDPLTLTHIAERYGISVSTASHLFKQAFGQSPMRYVIEIRLSIASERILYSDMKLEDIAEASGFRSYPYFSRAFRNHFHTSPSKYRVRNQLRKVENP